MYAACGSPQPPAIPSPQGPEALRAFLWVGFVASNKGLKQMKYCHDLFLHCIKTYGILILLGTYTPFLGFVVWAGIKNILI
jgi:hypothetical protein